MVLKALPDQVLLASLETSLSNLRQRWPRQWPGLPLVFERCWQQLGHSPECLGRGTVAMIALGQRITQHIETDGQRRAALGAEPAYHNRLHMADALVCMTYLLLALRQLQLTSTRSARYEALMLVTMAGHDFLHPGGRNAHPGQLENLSIQALIRACILATDPECVPAQHRAAASRRFDLTDPVWQSVLAQEADIMASALSQTQGDLTQALSREWALSTPAGVAQALLTAQGRLGFLQHAALFTSPAAHHLGMAQVRAAQIQTLQERLAKSQD
jgi:hypothetical protein